MLPTLEKIISISLIEDKTSDDLTSDLTISSTNQISFAINARQNLVFCSSKVILEVFNQLAKSPKFLNQTAKIDFLLEDAFQVQANEAICLGSGSPKLIFAAERTILNLIQHLSGIATLTRQFVEKLNNPKIKILDTRKTLPGLREMQKYAVSCGGGSNHRFDLSEMILIKDNHIAAAGSIENCLKLLHGKIAKNPELRSKKIEIECDNLAQIQEILSSESQIKPDFIMLDNMSIQEIKQASTIIRTKFPQTKIEVSGGVNLESIATYRDLNIDFISIGSLTHSVKACDIGLDII